MGRHVMMICRDPERVSDLAAALDEVDRLTVVDSPAAVVDHDGVTVDAIVVDLPADTRRAVYQEVRERYRGQLVVPVGHPDEVAGWPPDPARRVLVRPFPATEMVAGIRPDRLSAERAAEARRQVRLRPRSLIRPTSAEPLDPPDAASTAGAGAGGVQVDGPRDGVPSRAAPPDAATESGAGGGVGSGAAANSGIGARTAAGSGTVPGAATRSGTVAGAAAGSGTGPEAAAGSARAAAAGSAGDAAAAGSAGDAAASAAAADAPVERLSPDQPLWDPPAESAHPGSGLARTGAIGTTIDLAQTGPDQGPGILDRRPDIARLRGPREAAPRRRSPWRVALASVAAVALFLAGAFAGSVLSGGGAGTATATTSAPPPSPPPPSAAASQQQAGPALAWVCAAAIDDADAAISYLVAKIRDRRLADALRRYGDHARACRLAAE
jgi:hypothetical protein